MRSPKPLSGVLLSGYSTSTCSRGLKSILATGTGALLEVGLHCTCARLLLELSLPSKVRYFPRGRLDCLSLSVKKLILALSGSGLMLSTELETLSWASGFESLILSTFFFSSSSWVSWEECWDSSWQDWISVKPSSTSSRRNLAVVSFLFGLNFSGVWV